MGKAHEGPWEAIRTKPIAGCSVTPGWAISPVSGRKPLLDIAHVYLTASQDEATQEANARLIAAAPELLAALNEVAEDLACDGDVSDATLDLIASVTKKATGC